MIDADRLLGRCSAAIAEAIVSGLSSLLQNRENNGYGKLAGQT